MLMNLPRTGLGTDIWMPKASHQVPIPAMRALKDRGNCNWEQEFPHIGVP